MSQLEQAIELGAEIKRLREQEAALASQRHAKEEELRSLITNIEATRRTEAVPPATVGGEGKLKMRDKVLEVLRSHPDRSFNAEELAPIAEVENLPSLRTLFSILWGEGMILRVSKGRYQHKTQ